MHKINKKENEIHYTWEKLKPLKNFNQVSNNDESKTQYVTRIQKQFSIPKEVLTQWLFEHYHNEL